MPPIAQNVIHLALGEIIDRLIGGDAIFIEPARLLARFEDRHLMAKRCKLVCAGKSRRSSADHRHPPARARTLCENLLAGIEHHVRRMALQPSDLHGLAFRDFANAHLLAQGLRRAHPPAHAAHDVGGENGLGRADRIPGGDLPDEQGNVDCRGTSLDTGRVIAEQAAFRRHPRVILVEPRLDIREISVIRLRLEPARGNVRQFRHDSPSIFDHSIKVAEACQSTTPFLTRRSGE